MQRGQDLMCHDSTWNERTTRWKQNRSADKKTCQLSVSLQSKILERNQKDEPQSNNAEMLLGYTGKQVRGKTAQIKCQIVMFPCSWNVFSLSKCTLEDMSLTVVYPFNITERM